MIGRHAGLCEDCEVGPWQQQRAGMWCPFRAIQFVVPARLHGGRLLALLLGSGRGVWDGWDGVGVVLPWERGGGYKRRGTVWDLLLSTDVLVGEVPGRWELRE